MANRNIKRAVIEYEDGETFEIEGGPALELAHKIIESCYSEMEIKLPDAKRVQFHKQAEAAWTKSGVSMDRATFITVWKEKEAEKYFAIERCNHAYNEMVFAKIQKA